ncbi:MAG: hypothetical protein AB7L41_03215 [Flavobacteriaceae bacterium]
MKKLNLAVVAVAAMLAMPLAPATAADGPHVAPIKEYVTANVLPWLSDPVVVNAIKAQNEKNASLGQADIDKLDKQWRAEVDAGSKPMIDGVMGNELSKFLAQKKEASGGLITEAFVMDDKGLNVGQSDVTSDYWQGDEAKWKETYAVGPDAIFVDEIEKDESTQQLQSQVSVSIKDESGKAIGAITLGVNVDAL